MNERRLQVGLQIAMLSTGALLFADLFLRWQDLSSTSGLMHTEIATGWHGPGAFAGILLMVLYLRALIRALGAKIGTLLDAVAAVGILICVIARTRDFGETTIGLTTLTVHHNRWPAVLGVVLAATFAGAAVSVVAQGLAARHRSSPRGFRTSPHA